MAEPSPFGAAELARHAAERPDGIAIRSLPRHDFADNLTWKQLNADSRLIAACISAEAVFRPGMRIGWLGLNDAHMLTLLFACARLGAALVPLNWRLSDEELRWIEANAGFRYLAGPWRWPASHPHMEYSFYDDWTERYGDDETFQCYDPACYRDWNVTYQHEWESLARVPVPPPDVPLLIGYTSGTTGRPKGAMLSQAAFAANARHAQAVFGFTAEDRVLTVLPMFHVGGLNIQTVPALLAGAQVLLADRFEADGFFDDLEAFRPTLTLLVPAVMRALVTHPRWTSADFSSLRAVGAGSSEVPLDLIEAFHAKGVPVQQVYGATETSPIAIAQTRAEALAAPGSIGRPVPGVEARLAPGTGEILVRGPNVMSGYWGDPAATAAALRDGWFATGDVGRVDEHGRWWFTDRLKHLIISGGENISPAEVERVLATAPGVREGAVVGRPDPRWGEVPVAVVVPGEGYDPARVLAHFNGRLARFKHPREVLALEALPRTALGKVAVAKLREVVSAGSATPA